MRVAINLWCRSAVPAKRKRDTRRGTCVTLLGHFFEHTTLAHACCTARTMSNSIHVLTLNCWGLKYLAAHRHERLKQIGAEIAAATPQPSIVALQECWTQQDYESIRAQTKHILPHGKFYFSGIMGGGLAILSKWPIESSNMLRYVLNGRPTAFFRGDWFVGKGVACAKIRLSDGSQRGRYLSVFCTHVR